MNFKPAFFLFICLSFIFSMPFYKIMVPTVDTVRYDFLVYSLLQAKRPVLLTGPVGTGKTSLAQKVLQRLDPKMYSLLVINMSAQVRKLITNLTSLFYGFSLECNDLSRWYKIGFSNTTFAKHRETCGLFQA